MNVACSHSLVRSPLACRIGWGVSVAWAERKREIFAVADEFVNAKTDPRGHGAVAILMAALHVGPDVISVAAALSFDLTFVAECAGRLREAGIWLNNSMIYPWIEDDADAYVGCLLDSLVATGDVVKVGHNSYRARAAA